MSGEGGAEAGEEGRGEGELEGLDCEGFFRWFGFCFLLFGCVGGGGGVLVFVLAADFPPGEDQVGEGAEGEGGGVVVGEGEVDFGVGVLMRGRRSGGEQEGEKGERREGGAGAEFDDVPGFAVFILVSSVERRRG